MANKRTITSKLADIVGNEEEVNTENNTNSEQGNEDQNNQNNEGNDNMVTETVAPTVEEKEVTSIRRIVRSQKRKKTLDETHSRATFLVENELLDKLNYVCDGTRGLKTKLINEALQIALAEFDEEYEEYLASLNQ